VIVGAPLTVTRPLSVLCVQVPTAASVEIFPVKSMAEIIAVNICGEYALVLPAGYAITVYVLPTPPFPMVNELQNAPLQYTFAFTVCSPMDEVTVAEMEMVPPMTDNASGVSVGFVMTGTAVFVACVTVPTACIVD